MPCSEADAGSGDAVQAAALRATELWAAARGSAPAEPAQRAGRAVALEQTLASRSAPDWPHHLPAPRRAELTAHALELAAELSAEPGARPAGAGPRLLGVNGAQGSGKSTLAAMLAAVLADTAGWRCAVLSIDDFYCTQARRRELAQSVHPLLATRGVPGTHDVELALATLQALRGASGDVALPRFDKASDDRCPPTAWGRARLPLDLVILEGWCVGAAPQTEAELAAPVNALEAEEDTDGRWRRYVNAALAGDYQRLFSALDGLLMLDVVDFERVLRWRGEQEAELRRQCGGGMTDAALRRFVMHYERLTRHQLATLPRQADWVLRLDAAHGVDAVQVGAGDSGVIQAR